MYGLHSETLGVEVEWNRWNEKVKRNVVSSHFVLIGIMGVDRMAVPLFLLGSRGAMCIRRVQFFVDVGFG